MSVLQKAHLRGHVTFTANGQGRGSRKTNKHSQKLQLVQTSYMYVVILRCSSGSELQSERPDPREQSDAKYLLSASYELLSAPVLPDRFPVQARLTGGGPLRVTSCT